MSFVANNIEFTRASRHRDGIWWLALWKRDGAVDVGGSVLGDDSAACFHMSYYDGSGTYEVLSWHCVGIIYCC